MNKITDIKIQHEDITSLHIQLYTAIRDLILSGKWSPNSQIPSESQLSTHLNISRTTVRLALQHAEIEKLINRSPGRGTFVAKNIKQQKPPKLIAFITNWSEQGAHKTLLTGAEAVASEHNYRIIFCNSRNAEEEQELLHSLLEDRISGVLLWPHSSSSTDYTTIFDRYHSKHIPIVCMDRPIRQTPFDCVTSDNYDSASNLMTHLLDLGHRKIAFLSHRHMDIQPVKERYRAYQDALQHAQLQPLAPCLIGPNHRESSEELERAAYHNEKNSYTREFSQLLKPATYTAIFAVNNLLALFAIRVITHLNITIPDEMSVACFDDMDGWLVTTKPLTTVVQDMFAIGQRAAERLIHRIEGYSGPPAYDVIASQLVIRQSTSVPVQSLSE